MFGGISQLDKILFARHLAIMLKSGMPFSEALVALREQTDSKKLKEVVDYCLEAVKQGESLGRALQHYQRYFSPLFLHMIEVGEESGSLVSNLEYLALQLKKSYDLKRKVRSAMMYPAIVFIATLGLGAGLAFFIFPKLIKFFESLNVTLPLPTRILLWTAYRMQEYGLHFILATLVVVAIIWYLRRFRKVKFFFHHLWLRLPWIGPLVKKVNLAYFARTLSSLLQAGINIVECLEVSSQAMGNLVYAQKLKQAQTRVQSGEAFGDILKEQTQYFPPTASYMIEVGEQTGTLSETLLYLADFYEEEVDSATQNLAEILEPILLIIMGIVVGFVAISIILPIYKITQGLEV